MRYLTKSRFTTAITCPRKLAYLDDPAYASTNTDNEFLLALAEGGHQVGALAKCLFPAGIEILAAGHDAQVQKTNELLAVDDVVLFEAAIRVGSLFVRIDLLHKHGNVLELYEVKAKSFDSSKGAAQIRTRTGIGSEFKPYLYDVAFQRHVLKKAFPDAIIRCYLVMPDKSKLCEENGLAQRLKIERTDNRSVTIKVDESLRDGAVARHLLHVLQVDEFVDTLMQSELQAGGYKWAFDEGIEELEARIDGPTFDARIGSHCKSCEFRTNQTQTEQGFLDGRTECWNENFQIASDSLKSGTVFDLYNFRSFDAVLASGRILLSDLEQEDVKYKLENEKISLSQRQWLQCEESRQAPPQSFLVADKLSEKLDLLEFPLNFIDFETATPALPFHTGLHPYELVFFQFSVHQLDHDGTLRHSAQHISAQQGEFPSFDTARALRSVLATNKGSVIHWWTHERTVLSKVREQLLRFSDPPADRDELVQFIDDLLGKDEQASRLVDLGQHITHPLVFLPGTKGSSSIKKVLPAILNLSARVQQKYGQAIYGAADGIPSMNFCDQAWAVADSSGRFVDPYDLLGGRFNEPDLDALENTEESLPVVANGGAAMVAYGLLQTSLLDPEARESLIRELLRYCELDTLAMVMIYEGLRDIRG